VSLEDPSPTALAVAEQIGAGRALGAKAPAPAPTIVVVAVPPDVAAEVTAAALDRFRQATVTDVASVKAVVLAELRAKEADLARYVGSHPMAGKEQAGPAAASADLFVGRPWVIVAAPETSPAAGLAVRALAADLGSHPAYLDAAAHDAAVALVSHVPQILSSLTAARLAEAPAAALDLAGQGLRDMTRIARSDPNLWAAILAGNGPAIAGVLREVRADLERAIVALELGVAGATLGRALVELSDLIASGGRGAARIPGKHGGAPRSFDVVRVLVPDRPGELGRLFQEMGQWGVNLEDLALEHGAGQLVGLAAIAVASGEGRALAANLERAGWRVLV
jgi:prephenate dehydrogenase